MRDVELPSEAAIITWGRTISDASCAASTPVIFVLPKESIAIQPNKLFSPPSCLLRSDWINCASTKPPFLDMVSPFSKTTCSSCPFCPAIFLILSSIIFIPLLWSKLFFGILNYFTITAYNQILSPIINYLGMMETLFLFIYNNYQRVSFNSHLSR